MLDAFIDAAAAKIEAAQIVTDDLFGCLKRWVFLSERLNCRNGCRRLIEFIDLMLSEISETNEGLDLRSSAFILASNSGKLKGLVM